MSRLIHQIRRLLASRRYKKASTAVFLASAVIFTVHFVFFSHHFEDSGVEITSNSIVNGAGDNSVPPPVSVIDSFFGFLGLDSAATDGKKTIPFGKSGVELNEENSVESLVQAHQTSKDIKRRAIGSKFFNGVFQTLYRGRPPLPELRRYKTDKRIYHARYDSLAKDDLVFSEKYLASFLDMTDMELQSMTHSHKYVMDHLPEVAPKGLYSGNGIVYVGGGKFNWLTLLSIKSLRSLGSKVPIEVLIPKREEYEADLCNDVLPALNAKCIYLPLELKEHSLFEFKGYQYKALAILLSSFENVLLLDSDNIPVHKPDDLFKKEPFKSHGLIVWPDFWKRATSPHYYKIAGIHVSEDSISPRYNEIDGHYDAVEDEQQVKKLKLDDIPLHQRVGSIPDPTSESGQLMVSKKTHTKSLLLALFYNLYGPSHFYPLFSQGSDGEGDKETFLAATVATNKPFYQVSKFLNAFGYFNIQEEFEGTGMGQYDPIEDFELVQQRLGGKEIPEAVREFPRILFVHANWPKLNPWQLKITRRIFDELGNRLRLYGTGMKLRTGYDFEQVQWQHMKELLCDLEIKLDTYSDVSKAELCKEIEQHLVFLKSTESTLE